MITKNDCLVLLKDIKDKGIVDTSKMTQMTVLSADPPLEVIEFINAYRPFEINSFYEKLRKSYNKKKSVLYKNLVKEIDDPTEVLITLSSLNLQILLYAKKVENRRFFLQCARCDEITSCLLHYYKTYDIVPCIKLLRYIKSDLKAFEQMRKDDE